MSEYKCPKCGAEMHGQYSAASHGMTVECWQRQLAAAQADNERLTQRVAELERESNRMIAALMCIAEGRAVIQTGYDGGYKACWLPVVETLSHSPQEAISKLWNNDVDWTTPLVFLPYAPTETCPSCQGVGWKDDGHTGVFDCEICGGAGFVSLPPPEPSDE